MKIVFLNVWNCKVTEEIQKFFEEQAKDTEVFCLQEAYEKTKWMLKNILQDYKLISDYKHISDEENFPQVTYVRKDIECVDTKTLLKDLPATGLALHTQLKYKDKNINVCNVHGVSRPGDKMDNEKRLRQSQEIIDAYRNFEGLKIIGGDFNLEANTKSVKLFEENDYVNLIKEYKIPTTRNNLIWSRYPDSKQYFSDYIFVDHNVHMTDFQVPNNEISDHLPMMLDFTQ